MFKDIAELPHVAGGLGLEGFDVGGGGSGGLGGLGDDCRPPPLGDRSATIGAEEEYI